WLNPLFKIGDEQKLKQDDMYSVLPEDHSQHLGEELQGYWDQEVLRAKTYKQEPSLMKAIIKCYWKSCLVLGIFTFLEEGTRVVQPIFLGKMVSYIENYDPANSAALHEAYGYAAGLSACVLVWAILHHLYFYHMQRVGMRLRVAVCHMIYRKVSIARCIRQALKEKITILVTHQLQYLEDASQILILKDGKTVKRGTYSEFLKSRVDILSLFDNGNKQSEPSPVPGTPTLISKSLSWSLQSPRPSWKDVAPEDQDTENIQVTLPLEDQLERKVDFKTYASYFTAGAHWSVIIFLILVNIAAQVAYVLQDWWLLNWANVQSGLYFGTYVEEATDVMFVLNWFLGVYSGLIVSTFLFGITRSLLLFYVLANSSQTLHNKMLESILRAPVLFFNRNPIGRILNRFSKDIGHMDDLLPQIFQDFIQTFLLVIGVMGVMVAVIPWVTVLVIPFGIIFFAIQWYFLRSSRDVKCLESAAQSPVFSHLASSLRGLGTIRAYKAEHKFQKLFDTYQDLHSEACFLLLTMSQQLAMYLDVICAIFVTVVAFAALILADTLNPGDVGLVLSLIITFTGMFQWCIRQSTEVENMMISVQRGIEYTDLEKEAPWELEYRPPPSWPHEGRIYITYVNFKYSLDGPLVLKNLDTLIDPREK
ncbi:TPA: ATP-binding cassette, sub-family C, member 4-like, partial [Bos taurus]